MNSVFLTSSQTPPTPWIFISLSSLVRCIKSGPGCGWAGQQPVQGGQPCQGGFCSDGPRSSCTAAQAPHESHIPPWPLLLHSCGQGKPYTICHLFSVICISICISFLGDTTTSNIEKNSIVYSCLLFIDSPAWCWLHWAHKCFYRLRLLALWRLNLSHGSHSVVKGISLDRVKCGYS